jgi:microcystin-dependent protein
MNSEVGDITMFAGNTIPQGWKICDGSALSKTTYSDLYTFLGGTYGETETTFNLPNFTCGFPIGTGKNTEMKSSFDLGAVGGKTEIHLTEENIPSHSHEMSMIASTSTEYSNTPSENYLSNSNLEPSGPNEIALYNFNGNDKYVATPNLVEIHTNITENTPLSILNAYQTTNFIICVQVS